LPPALQAPSLLLTHGQPIQEQSTTDIWHCICNCVRRVITESAVDPHKIKGIGFDATCSLAVFSTDTDEPVPVTGPDFTNDGNDRNVILWLDHRPVEETEKINNTKHKLLKYVGGKMSIEMEIPKALWLKNNMPPELFAKCKFYDLTDALTHLATGNETRSFCSTVCKQGYVPVGVDGSEKGWQEDFFQTIGLGDLAKADFERMGGVNGVVRNSQSPPNAHAPAPPIQAASTHARWMDFWPRITPPLHQVPRIRAFHCARGTGPIPSRPGFFHSFNSIRIEATRT
jgi:FGGY-family pentulose kinase